MTSYTQSTSIGSLSPEIISLILTTAIPAIYESGTGESRFRFPAIMSRVSRRFRQAALSTPPLWSYLYLTSSPSERKLAHIQDRINRKSGDALLDIQLLLHNNGLNTEHVIATLSSCSTRWGSLSVSIPFRRGSRPSTTSATYSKSPIWDLLRAPAPHLRFISIHAPGQIHHATPNPSLPHPFSFPNTTRSLELTNCNRFWGELNFKFPSSLETLTILEVDPEFHLKTVLGALEPLRRTLKLLKLGFGLSNLSDDQIQTPCILEQLRILEVNNMPIHSMMRLLTFLKAPNLLRLSIQSPGVEKSDQYTPTRKESILQGWKEANFPMLTGLFISDISNPSSDLDVWIMLLQGLAPSATYLEVHADENSGEMTGLLGDHRLDQFFGQLKQVTMLGFSAAEITSTVKGRCNSLRWLQVRNNDMKLGYNRTKKEFEDNNRDVEDLRSIVNLQIMKNVDLPRDRFSTWEEGQVFKALQDKTFQDLKRKGSRKGLKKVRNGPQGEQVPMKDLCSYSVCIS